MHVKQLLEITKSKMNRLLPWQNFNLENDAIHTHTHTGIKDSACCLSVVVRERVCVRGRGEERERKKRMN